MTYVVVKVLPDMTPRESKKNKKVHTFGYWDSPEEAERARRRIHYDAVRELSPWADHPATYVSKIESEPS